MIRPVVAPGVFTVVLVVLFLILTPYVAEGDSGEAELHVISSHFHDGLAFTQGLEMHDGSLYESTGLYGHSSLREVNPSSGEILRQMQINESLFGEGITVVGDTIVMLTWKEGIALIFDIETFEIVGNHTYSGDGWGLCNDGTHLVMSNGTSELAFRDPEDFTVQSTIEVTLDGHPTNQLNELECSGGMIYANVWGSDSILAINSTTGVVEFTVDASQLAESKSGRFNMVLNGIAYVAEHDAFLITGKNWTSMHLVRFESVQEPFEDNNTEPESVTSATSSPPRSEVLSLSFWLGIPLTLVMLFLWTSGTPGSGSQRRIHNPPASRAPVEGDR